jgi:hypothetical protein
MKMPKSEKAMHAMKKAHEKKGMPKPAGGKSGMKGGSYRPKGAARKK